MFYIFGIKIYLGIVQINPIFSLGKMLLTLELDFVLLFLKHGLSSREN